MKMFRIVHGELSPKVPRHPTDEELTMLVGNKVNRRIHTHECLEWETYDEIIDATWDEETGTVMIVLRTNGLRRGRTKQFLSWLEDSEYKGTSFS